MNLKKYAFTLVIIGVVILAFIFPTYFIQIAGIKLNTFIKPLLQLIMLGMGATIKASDFIEVIKAPKKVAIGLLCQFTIMPFLGYFLANAFKFEPEIAAGIILIGCSPSGLASNVMAMMAKANVALSITITTLATLAAPVLTPLLMKTLGGNLIEVDFWLMFFDMGKLVIVPVIIGVFMNKFLPTFVEKIKTILPYFSMFGIAFIILVVTASGHEALKAVGILLVLVNFLHNIGGYTLGYFGAKLFKMNEPDARAIAFEVGMQNAGLASALANEMGKLATVGLSSAIFGPIMNISGSVLANIWGSKKNINKKN
jgi:bile acid:Na+ symporter, BASS family